MLQKINKEGLLEHLDKIGIIDNYKGFISHGEFGFYLDLYQEKNKYNIEDDDVIIIYNSPLDIKSDTYLINLGE